MYPLEQMASLCGMVYLPPFTLFSARSAVGENRLQAHIDAWQRLLRALQSGHVDILRAQSLPTLNDNLDAIIQPESP